MGNTSHRGSRWRDNLDLDAADTPLGIRSPCGINGTPW